MKDYYKLLGIPRDSSDNVIAKAYKILAKKYHPDLNKSPEAEVKIRELNEAWEVLSMPEKKAKYDAELVGVNNQNRVEKRPYNQNSPYSEFENYINRMYTNNQYTDRYINKILNDFISDIDDDYEYRMVRNIMKRKRK